MEQHLKKSRVGKYWNMVQRPLFFFSHCNLIGLGTWLLWRKSTELISLQDILQFLVAHLLQRQALRAKLFASFNIMLIGLQMLLLLDELTPETHLAFSSDKRPA